MRIIQRAAVVAMAVAVAGTVLSGSGPANASASASAAPSGGSLLAATDCLAPASTSARTTPEWRGRTDVPVTQADLDALPPADARRSYVAREIAPRLPARVDVPVYVHVIKGTHRGELSPAGPARVRRAIAILNDGMAGKQSSLSSPTRYRFVLKKIDYTKRDSWYHASFYGPRDKQVKRRLHRGGAGTLNLYLQGGPRDSAVLGWSRFPWQYASAPKLDGVSVNPASLLGGSATGYNRGDTVIHEVGHWLGLLHTFQGGCSASNDLVADTAAEGQPSYECQTTRDTCTAPGLDPVRNFMDYSFDTCMTMLTAGQTARIDAAFEKYRY